MGSTTSDDEIRNAARLRVATIFRRDVVTLDDGLRFDTLQASLVALLKANEFDRIDFDIRDVADKETRNALATGSLVIHTVGDYCDHMVRCHRSNASEVRRLLKLR